MFFIVIAKTIEAFQMTINRKITKLYYSSTMKYSSENRDSYIYMDESYKQ